MRLCVQKVSNRAMVYEGGGKCVRLLPFPFYFQKLFEKTKINCKRDKCGSYENNDSLDIKIHNRVNLRTYKSKWYTNVYVYVRTNEMRCFETNYP